ncbi:uncharacterized protein LOC143232843 isoform X2 [Tachypleus tridentatus]|uniref:uncharacterized protein LOC143232843 isoform X2 n=1 Tax=Tachypleus tridentatus TaxID=6853 RepID=UPI003FD45343
MSQFLKTRIQTEICWGILQCFSSAKYVAKCLFHQVFSFATWESITKFSEDLKRINVSVFTKFHSEKQVNRKKNGEALDVLCNEELLLETKSFNGEDISEDEDENHVICSNSCTNSVNCKILLEEPMEDQTQNHIHIDKNACVEGQFSELDENQEKNEQTRDLGEQSTTNIEMQKNKKGVGRKEDDEVVGVSCNEELLVEEKSFNEEYLSGDEVENHMNFGNSCNSNINCEILLEELMEDQSHNDIHKDKNADCENMFFGLNEHHEDEETRNLDVQPETGIEISKNEFCEREFNAEDSSATYKEQNRSSSSDEHHCTQCVFSSKSYLKLLTHSATHQDYQEDKRPFRCLECGKKFKAEGHLRQHQEAHAQFELVKCSLCNNLFRKGSGLATHMRVHLRKNPSSQSCENVKLNSQEIIVRKITNTGDKRFHCSVCDKGFSCTNNVMKHYIAKHDPNNPNIPSTSFETPEKDNEIEKVSSTDSYPCEKCGRLFTSLKTLEGHRKIHRNETENRRFRCPYCKYSTNKSTDLRNHVAIHTNERPHQCNLCGKGFTEQSSLRKHMLTHTGEKPYACEVCGKKFTQRGHTNIHMRIHNKEKPYRCPYCEKTFAYHNVLTRHLKTHTEDRPYKCTYCSKTFKRSSALQGHEIAQHTHEYPLKCTECGKGFIEFGNMQIHLRNTHNIAIYKLKEDHN